MVGQLENIGQSHHRAVLKLEAIRICRDRERKGEAVVGFVVCHTKYCWNCPARKIRRALRYELDKSRRLGESQLRSGRGGGVTLLFKREQKLY